MEHLFLRFITFLCLRLVESHLHTKLGICNPNCSMNAYRKKALRCSRFSSHQISFCHCYTFQLIVSATFPRLSWSWKNPWIMLVLFSQIRGFLFVQHYKTIAVPRVNINFTGRFANATKIQVYVILSLSTGMSGNQRHKNSSSRECFVGLATCISDAFSKKWVIEDRHLLMLKRTAMVMFV